MPVNVTFPAWRGDGTSLLVFRPLGARKLRGRTMWPNRTLGRGADRARRNSRHRSVRIGSRRAFRQRASGPNTAEPSAPVHLPSGERFLVPALSSNVTDSTTPTTEAPKAGVVARLVPAAIQRRAVNSLKQRPRHTSIRSAQGQARSSLGGLFGWRCRTAHPGVSLWRHSPAATHSSYRARRSAGANASSGCAPAVEDGAEGPPAPRLPFRPAGCRPGCACDGAWR
jgi:hypothetical protein